LTIELVGPAEVVDDFGNGFAGLGVALVVRLAPFEKLPFAAMPAVEPLGVYAVDVAHASGNIGIGGLNQQMIVVGHQTISGYAQVPHLRGFNQHLNESLIVVFVEKDLFGPSASVHNMIPGVRVFDS
jgi:hypothetical protein